MCLSAPSTNFVGGEGVADVHYNCSEKRECPVTAWVHTSLLPVYPGWLLKYKTYFHYWYFEVSETRARYFFWCYAAFTPWVIFLISLEAASHMRKFRTFLLVLVKLICMLSHAGEGKEYIHFLSCSVTRMLEEEFRQKELVLLRWEGWYHTVTFPCWSSWIGSLISPGRCCFSESLKFLPFPPLHFQWNFETTISQGIF